MNKFKKSITLGIVTGSLSLALVQPAFALFDKTRFVADLGMAYFAFHHFVVKPYENKEFDASAPHHKKAMLKAALATGFAYLEVKHASKLAHTSKDPMLMKLGTELDKLTGAFSGITSKFKSGKAGDADMKSLSDTFSGVTGSVKSSGFDVQDKETKIPGLSDKG